MYGLEYERSFQEALRSQREQYEERIKELEQENKELYEKNESLKTETRLFTETIQAIKEMEIRKKIAALLLGEEQ